MSGRDARVDPRAGDVLRNKRGAERHVIGYMFVPVNGTVAEALSFRRGGADDRTRWCGMNNWRRWAAGAEVLRTGEEE